MGLEVYPQTQVKACQSLMHRNHANTHSLNHNLGTFSLLLARLLQGKEAERRPSRAVPSSTRGCDLSSSRPSSGRCQTAGRALSSGVQRGGQSGSSGEPSEEELLHGAGRSRQSVWCLNVHVVLLAAPTNTKKAEVRRNGSVLAIGSLQSFHFEESSRHPWACWLAAGNPISLLFRRRPDELPTRG